MMGKSIHTRYIINLTLVVAAFIISCIFFSFRHHKQDKDQQLDRFVEVFHEKDLFVKNALSDFVVQYQNRGDSLFLDEHYIEFLENRYNNNGIIYMYFDVNYQPVFWSHNSAPLVYEVNSLEGSGSVRLRNGWYYYRQEKNEDGFFFVLSVVKYGFKYQNRYLVNRFYEDYPVSNEAFFISDQIDQGFPVFDTDGKYVFSLLLRRTAALVKTSNFIWIMSVTLAVLALLLFIFISFRYFSALIKRGKRTIGIFGFIGIMILFRIITFLLKTPASFYEGKLFSPALYASSWVLPSLGDLLFNVLIFSIISFFIFIHFKNFATKASSGKWISIFLSILIFGMIYALGGLAVYLVRGLVINSHLNFNINFIFNIDIYSIVGFIVFGLIFISFFFLSVILFKHVEILIRNRRALWLVFASSLVLYVTLHILFFTGSLLTWMLFISSGVFYNMERKSSTGAPGFRSLIAALFIFSFIATIGIHHYNNLQELETRKTYAIRMASEQDPVAEFMFMEIEQALFNDNQLKNLVVRDPYDEPAIYRYLQYHYFYDFWAKYDMQITICTPGDMLLVKPQNVEVDCLSFFEDIIDVYGKATLSENFIYLDNNTGRNSYITIVPVVIGEPGTPQSQYNIYIEFDSKFIPRDMGFPELLIDQDSDVVQELSNYSYATYKDGNLINKYGAYNYNINISTYGEFHEEFSTFEFDDYHHLVFQKEENLQIVVSRPQESFLEKIAPFSYLFVLFFVLIVIMWLLTSQQNLKDFRRMNFKKRVQFSMITIVIASIFTIGGVSAWFIFNIHKDKNNAFISEKTHSVLVELEHLLADQPYLDYNWESYLSDLALRLSNIYFTDINIYDPDGILLASSRPKVFEEGLISPYMNPQAFNELRSMQKSRHIHSESIGELNYISAYAPLRNNENNLLAYINLPYFAKQNELRNELSYFLVAFLNIYLLLMVGAILLALFISNHITRPLQLIRDNMAKVQLGRTNKKIQWNRIDEIGSLISEYNRMIDELAISADLLARSERESAWREMAKQVAHEIKNPLTPMRLSVQYLEKAWKENDPLWEERLRRFSKTMIEQIDNLSQIAEVFSDFARMPSGDNKKVDLHHFVQEVSDLYKDFENLKIKLHFDPEGRSFPIYADRKQLLRVFNNLIKNSIQAYYKNEQAVIEISCRQENGNIITEVKDYGSGIPESQKPSIFTPYFTTKTGGMGLGLSMVKNIIESFNGEISFYSEEGKGTIFFISIPEFKQER